MTALAYALDVVVLALFAHTVFNAVVLRRPPRGACVEEMVSILMPMRDEATRLEPSLRSVLAKDGLLRRGVVPDQQEGVADVDVGVRAGLTIGTERLNEGAVLPKRYPPAMRHTPAGRAIVGLSAGCYGATMLGLNHLGEFSVIESWSGYFHATDPSGNRALLSAR